MTAYITEPERTVCKRVYNCLKIVKGSFPYDSLLGSRLTELDASAENAEDTCRRMIEEALMQVPGTSLEDFTLTLKNHSFILRVSFTYLCKSYETEVDIYG